MPSGQYPRTKEWKEKFSAKLRESASRYWLGKKRTHMTGKKHFAWKGNEVGKGAVHDWIKSRLGKPNFCEQCKTTKAKRFEWANKNHTYRRRVSDWIRLCSVCHCKYDDRMKRAWITRKKIYSKL